MNILFIFVYMDEEILNRILVYLKQKHPSVNIVSTSLEYFECLYVILFDDSSLLLTDVIYGNHVIDIIHIEEFKRKEIINDILNE